MPSLLPRQDRRSRRLDRLTLAVVLFVVLDLGVLALNFWISGRLEADAVAINLAGRQRMLSQRLTKALLLAQQAPGPAQREAAREEARQAANLFDGTLSAFLDGGPALGGDQQPLVLDALSDAQARYHAQEAARFWRPWGLATRAWINTPDEAHLREAVALAIASNQAVLQAMNQLTSRIEAVSREGVLRLRAAQVLAFLFALGNFLYILRLLTRRFDDATAWKERFQHQALHDALTGLPNRRHLNETAERVLLQAARFQSQPVVAVIDLDHFKPTNDQFGHQVGDKLLVEVARRLHSCVREGDLVARTGGDEFVCLFANVETGLLAVEGLGRRLANSLVSPMALPGQVLPLQASIGLSRYPWDGTTLDQLMHSADNAMYGVKDAGRGGWAISGQIKAPPPPVQG